LQGDLPLKGSVLVVGALVLLERLLAVEELVAGLVGAWKEHQTTIDLKLLIIQRPDPIDNS